MARGAKPRKTSEPSARLIPPQDGVVVRMYRIGHGDCFLLAFPGETKDRPAYVLIDCGYKPGSPQFIGTNIQDITANIKAATGGHIDVAVITHEHQDHVNGISATNFKDITIGESWFAWTEDPTDDLAENLRQKFRDKLLGLLALHKRLAAEDPKQATKIEDFLSLEFGGESEELDFPAAERMLRGVEPAKSKNKQSMKIFKDAARRGVKYIRPHQGFLRIPGSEQVRVFALGPPRNPDLLRMLDPFGDEVFPGLAFAATSAEDGLTAAVSARRVGPFSDRYAVMWDEAFTNPEYGNFFTSHYGSGDPPYSLRFNEALDDAPWRRIDKDWLYSTEQLALAMNSQTNNASLVLAFEISPGGKVLLFAADAQRGNWLSWSKKDWQIGTENITARSLLARTILYKVGHHGSHNATLDGQVSDHHANLAWMADGDYAREFTAVITAVRRWAETQKHWDHPFSSIKNALLRKASGRVFQTDTDLDKMRPVGDVSDIEWSQFMSRTIGTRLYFDYIITTDR